MCNFIKHQGTFTSNDSFLEDTQIYSAIMEPYPQFLDLTSALNCHLEPQLAWLDASMPESDAFDFSAQ
jgi:hypothetical protein